MYEFDIELDGEVEIEAGVHHPEKVLDVGFRIECRVCSRHLIHVHPKLQLARITAQPRQIPPKKYSDPLVPHLPVAHGHLGELVLELVCGCLFARAARCKGLCCQVGLEELFVQHVCYRGRDGLEKFAPFVECGDVIWRTLAGFHLCCGQLE